jgi:hypothetical protein
VCDYRRGFALDFGFIDHLYTQLGTTSNYSALANIHHSQITTAHAKYFPARSVFTSSCLVTASNNGYSSASALWSYLNGDYLPAASFPHRLPYTTDSVVPTVFIITPLHGPSRKHRFQQHLYCCMLIRRRGNVSTEPLPRNKCCFRAVRLQRLFLWLHSSCFEQICHNKYTSNTKFNRIPFTTYGDEIRGRKVIRLP